jgi:phosphoribosyl 1,2-cyclic phosphate phosphodiesterase
MAAGFSVTFLGTGTSVGVPVIGCGCGVCLSDDPRNKRLRSSILVETPEVTLLVDSGPDLRAQALREGFTRLDAVFYTHAHLDHVTGFDELRAFCWRREDPLPLHATASCLDALKRMFGWAFSAENTQKGYVKPGSRMLDGPVRYGDLEITPFEVEHGGIETVGYLFRHDGGSSFAYAPDLKRMPETSIALLRGVGVVALDALRNAPHPTHLTTDEALELISEIRPGQAWLTHLGHENDHACLAASLPPGIGVAHDGLRIMV